ncbi:MAG: polyprenyl synthetase family protein [Candidatus Marinimicrobia bacterium]|nr:polyprenyl synthetase family protein [Candidatus Neomarinimicrobiota bacterium]
MDKNQQRYLDFLNWFNKKMENYEFPKEPKEFYEPIKYALSGTAKRLRPAILTLVGESYGIDKNDLFPASMAIEMIHNFSLVHDDIMDNDLQRHGQDTVHKKWNENIAILIGDGIYTLAIKELLFYSSSKYYEISKILLESITQVCEGQSFDMEFANREKITADEYLKMVEKKTGYLLSASAVIGAIIGGASKSEQNVIEKYMLSLGKIFQIQDDLLEITASSEKMGKSLGSDLAEGKKTFPVLIGYKLASKKQKEKLELLLNKSDISMENIKSFRNLMVEIGVINEIEKFIQMEKLNSKTLLKQLPKKVSKAIELFSEMIFNRQK